jgi:hypothetical protein
MLLPIGCRVPGITAENIEFAIVVEICHTDGFEG